MRSIALTFLLASTLTSSVGQAQNGDPKSPAKSTVQATGIGLITLKPTVLRLSIPIKIDAESAWDAADELRTVRIQVMERAAEMGAIAGTLKNFGYELSPNSSKGLTISRDGSTEPKFYARCYIVADFVLQPGEDHEETIAKSQAQLQDLVTLLPKIENARQSFSVSTGVSGLSSQQLDQPLALFVTVVSDEQRDLAYQRAFNSAQTQANAVLEALDSTPTSMAVQHSHVSYASSRRQQPLESALYRPDMNEVIGTYADAVEYKVRLTLSYQFDTTNR